MHPIWVLAHELGHVFGLVHEHQRPDRDTYIRYNPQNVVGFEAAMQEAEKKGFTPRQPCDEPDVNRECGWAPGAQYLKRPLAPDNQTPYDIDSIMHYDSVCLFGGKDTPSLPPGLHPLKFPICKICPEGDQVAFLNSPSRVPADKETTPKFYISQGDAAAIRLMYPHW
jgi:hypothetical protein